VYQNVHSPPESVIIPSPNLRRLYFRLLAQHYLRAQSVSVYITGAALPENNDVSAAYHYKWRNVYFELSQRLSSQSRCSTSKFYKRIECI